MSFLSTQKSYGNAAIILHWLVAPAVLFMLSLGYYMARLPLQPVAPRLALYQLHKSLGLTILLLVIIRLFIKWLGENPEWPAQMPNWQKITVTLTHLSLYGLMLVMVFSGLLMSSASGKPTVFWGWFNVSVPIEKNLVWAKVFNAMHKTSSLGLSLLIFLHVSGVVQHWWCGMPSLSRMWFSQRK